MIDFDIVGQNILTLGILAFIGYIIYQQFQKRKSNSLSNFREKFGKMFAKSKLK